MQCNRVRIISLDKLTEAICRLIIFLAIHSVVIETSLQLQIKRRMSGIQDLEICSIPFQVLGLQSFSLKNVNLSKNTKYPSLAYKFYSVLLIIILSSTFGILMHMTAELDEEAVSENELNSIIKFLMALLFANTLYASVIASVLKYFYMAEFFRVSSEISKLCSNEFNFDINYKVLKSESIKKYWLIAVATLILNIVMIGMFYSSGPLHHHLISIILATFLIFAVLRFAFYVTIINFHLKLLTQMVRIFFANPNNFKIYPKRKIKILRKVYCLIQQMAAMVNNAFGFNLLMLLALIVFAFIRQGYRMFMILIGSLSSFKTGREYLIIVG